jgi:DNA-binding SARP family transcriptional activator
LGKYPEVLTSCIHVIEELDRLINLDEKERNRKHNLMKMLGREKTQALKKY